MKAKLRICILSTSFLLSFVLLQGSGLAQTTYTVDVGGGGDFTAIQDCIDAASGGDTCRVNAGTYVENINFAGKEITVASTSGPALTILDGNHAISVVKFETGETAGAVLDGFTIRNGVGTPHGGGIYCDNASPTITNCILRDNSSQTGGGMYILGGGSVTITDCIFQGNQVSSDLGGSGGGIYFSGDSLNVLHCTFAGNEIMMGAFYAAGQGAGIAFFGNSLRIEQSVLRGNGGLCVGGGVYFEGGEAVILNSNLTGNDVYSVMGAGGLGGGIAVNGTTSVTNCTFHANSAMFGGAICLIDGSLALTNSILWGDSASMLPELALMAGSASVNYTDVQAGWAGTGNIDADPLFVDPAGGDYHLQGGSPCIDTGDNSAPDLPATDVDGDNRVIDGDGDSISLVDMGADEFLPAAVDWGTASTVPGDRSNACNQLALLLISVGVVIVLGKVHKKR